MQGGGVWLGWGGGDGEGGLQEAELAGTLALCGLEDPQVAVLYCRLRPTHPHPPALALCSHPRPPSLRL